MTQNCDDKKLYEKERLNIIILQEHHVAAKLSWQWTVETR